MAWNLPGDNGDKDRDPWGQRKRAASSGSSDVDQLVRNFQKRLSNLFGPRASGPGFGIGAILVIALGLWLLSGFYIVQESERGVVLRFGGLSEVVQRGLHWHLPYPIERVEKVNVERVSIIELGYRTNARSGGRSKVPREALMITGDENIVDIEFAVQYRIKEADAYLFNVRDPEVTIAQATESAVREAVGKSTLDFALTEGREQMASDAKVTLQQILDRYKAGIEVMAVETQRAQPPEEVKPAFDDAVKAREDEQRLKNEAEAYANDIIPRARGAAARMLQEAEGHKASVISRAEGDARRFSQILKEYAKAPAVTRERLYIEMMEQVLSSTTKVYVDQKGGNNMLYLPLDKLVPRADTAAAPSAPTAETEGGGPARESAARGRSDSRRRGTP